MYENKTFTHLIIGCYKDKIDRGMSSSILFDGICSGEGRKTIDSIKEALYWIMWMRT